jgi:two-component system, OmpR family, sensor histidine kinase KdpD
VVSLSAAAGFTLCYKLLITEVKTTIVAFSFLLVVLFAAATRGIGPGHHSLSYGNLVLQLLLSSSVRTFTIYDPQNWVLLCAFLVTDIIASQLSSTAPKRAREAEKSREEVWRLYQLTTFVFSLPVEIKEISKPLAPLEINGGT